MSEEMRMIPLTQEFLQNKKINDKIWAYLQLHSYVGNDRNGQKHRFIYENIAFSYNDLFNRVKSYVESGNGKKFCCYNTFVQCLKELAKINLIEKGTILLSQQEYNVYYLNEVTPNKLIPVETLRNLVSAGETNSIKIFTYLLNKYTYKQTTNELYQFTQQELSKVIGYKSTSKIKPIEEILQDLRKLELIQYHFESKRTPSKNLAYYHILDSVCLTSSKWNTFQKPNIFKF